MLVLFDIDGTLLLSHGASLHAVRDAAREIFGVDFATGEKSFGGRLDPLIWRELCAGHGIPEERQEPERFRAVYARKLTERLANGHASYALPGVTDLLAALTARDDVALGLLTGNFPETGELKLRCAGLDPALFVTAAWGCDAATRADLVPVALDRLRAAGRPVPAREQVVVLGDTPHDVDCAKVHGCRALAVATGSTTAERLEAAGADLVVPSLADTPTLVGWILESALQR